MTELNEAPTVAAMTVMRQRFAAFAIASLLTLVTPELLSGTDWEIEVDGRVLGCKSFRSLDDALADFRQWATILHGAEWSLKPHQRDLKKLSIVGTHQGVTITLWSLVEIPDGVDVSELSAQPQVEVRAENTTTITDPTHTHPEGP